VSIVHRLREPWRSDGHDAGGGVVIEAMRKRHLRDVLTIENQVYPKPWTPGIFQSELDEMRDGYRNYVIARIDGQLVGYAGLLYSGDDAHITNIAVDPEVQRRHIGARLLLHQARLAIDLGFRNLTLEVRTSNTAAQELYRRFGMAPAGIRKNYYEGVEDAIVMWCHDIDSAEYAERLRRVEANLAR
jgi:ribosomal-protein-alanine N-acetyltransferase